MRRVKPCVHAFAATPTDLDQNTLKVQPCAYLTFNHGISGCRTEASRNKHNENVQNPSLGAQLIPCPSPPNKSPKLVPESLCPMHLYPNRWLCVHHPMHSLSSMGCFPIDHPPIPRIQVQRTPKILYFTARVLLT